jgi:hypothetical protein
MAFPLKNGTARQIKIATLFYKGNTRELLPLSIGGDAAKLQPTTVMRAHVCMY